MLECQLEINSLGGAKKILMTITTTTTTTTDREKEHMSTMSLCNVVDQLHDKHRLTHPSSTKQKNLTTTLIGCQMVHNLKNHQNKNNM
jgi:hypothetical protein